MYPYPLVKRFANFCFLIGTLGMLFGLGSCLHPAPDDRTSADQDGDSSSAPYITGQRFVAGMSLGVVGISAGAYVRGIAKRLHP